MRSNYKRLGDYIDLVHERNTDLQKLTLIGLSIEKKFIPSIANTIGTDMATYRILNKNQFAYSQVTSRNGDKLTIALFQELEKALISQAYTIFEITKPDELMSEYLMMWFRRPEFDRFARFKSHGSARELFAWEDMCEVKMPIPHPDKQKEIVKEYNTITDRIALNNRLIQKLEETAQAVYKQWFVDFEVDNAERIKLDKFIEINPNLSLKKDALVSYVEMNDLSTDSMCINNFIQRPYSAGSKFQNGDTLLARITPCLENGKTGFVNFLKEKEVSFGSTEFIVMRARKDVSPYWVYCLAKDERFRSYAISSMIGSSGRQRVHEDYLKNYLINDIDYNNIHNFHNLVKPLFEMVRVQNLQRQKLEITKNILLSKLATIQT